MTFVGACGGRYYDNRELVRDTLSELKSRILGRIVLVTGVAPGADRLSRDIAYDELGWDIIDVPARWERQRRSAGPLRNDVIAALPLRYLVAFPGGAGTADMVRKARVAGIEVIEVRE